MIITVHDVGHGQCISLVHENGNVMLWDCGHADWGRPSHFLPASGIKRIERLVITNFDQDHISDLPSIRKKIEIRALVSNNSISPHQLEAIKLQGGPISPAMESMLDMMRRYTGGPPQPPPLFPDVEYKVYRNFYPAFTDTNNLSLVTFLSVCGLNFVIPGDLERPGWETLLSLQAFRAELTRTNIFVASHHGRESGYCREVFDYCSPDLILCSDSPLQFASQEMVNTYARHASGVWINGERRYVLTTRRDGPIQWCR